MKQWPNVINVMEIIFSSIFTGPIHLQIDTADSVDRYSVIFRKTGLPPSRLVNSAPRIFTFPRKVLYLFGPCRWSVEAVRFGSWVIKTLKNIKTLGVELTRQWNAVGLDFPNAVEKQKMTIKMVTLHFLRNSPP